MSIVPENTLTLRKGKVDDISTQRKSCTISGVNLHPQAYQSRPCHTCEMPNAAYPLQTGRSSCSLPGQTPVTQCHNANCQEHTVPIVKTKFGLTLKLTEPVLSLSNSRKIWSRNLSEVKWQIKLISSRKFENMAVQSDVVILMSIPCLSLKTWLQSSLACHTSQGCCFGPTLQLGRLL